MSSWFLGGGSGSGSSPKEGSNETSSGSTLKNGKTNNTTRVKELLPHLYPQSSAADAHHQAGAGSGGGSSGGGIFWGGSDYSSKATAGVTRFSTLLLEHGEQAIQDWAVVAYSAPWKAGLAAASQRTATPTAAAAATPTAGLTTTPLASSSSHKSKIQWAQSPQAASPGLGLASPAAQAAARKRDLRSMSSSFVSVSSSSLMGGNSNKNAATTFRSAADITRDEYPTVHMTKIEGRLYLCSRSLVFEPNDVSRGVLRCPWSRMSGLTTVNDDVSAIQIYTQRHVSIKVNNVLGPFETVQVPTKLRFCFLHSSPQPMMDLAQRLYRTASASARPTAGLAVSHAAEAEAQAYLLEQQQQSELFDMDNLVDVVREQLLLPPISAKILTPLQSQSGVLVITSAERLYFQPAHYNLGGGGAPMARAIRWKCADIGASARRYHGLRDSALEIYWKSGASAASSSRRRNNNNNKDVNHNNSACSTLIAFERRHDREQVLQLLPYTAPCVTDREFLTLVVQEWLAGNISNYDYLLALNSAAGRSFHDLSRYPVFPWVLSDYTSSDVPDLDNPQSFRDLSKPVGALNPSRLEYFQQRLANMQDLENQVFLYGTHYSAPAYVLYYLVRTMPEHMLCLQNGKFDAADRMFYSIHHCYQCCLTNHADVKELIPQFFSLDKFDLDFLRNARALSLGATQTGERVHDVKLPPWAQDSPRRFVQVNRQALESTYCTQQLPAWIDLIFGARSRGEAAQQANNLFHRMAYLGPRELADASPEERATAELQATEFGIVPDLLFQQAHPNRGNSAASVDMEEFLAPHVGRAPPSGDGGREAWELLDAPAPPSNGNKSKSSNRAAAPLLDESSLTQSNSQGEASSGRQSSSLNPANTLDSFGTAEPKNVPLRGTGETATAPNALTVETSHHNNNTTNPFETPTSSSNEAMHRPPQQQPSQQQPAPQQPPLPAAPRAAWDMKVLERRQLHSDAVSGCVLLLVDESADAELDDPTSNSLNPATNKRRSLLATTSLDGGLLVHKVSLHKSSTMAVASDTLGGGMANPFSSTFKSFSYSLNRHIQAATTPTSSGMGQPSQPTPPQQQQQQPSSKLTEYRTHSSRDPLASLIVAFDGAAGHVAFAGGHDDVVLAYGINSACAVASVYSHRDAVTGLDLVPRRNNDAVSALWLDNATHILISGSWDATVKVWSACISSGETVAIHREPLAELFDAEASIVSVSACALPGNGGIVIAAGCADGSFCVWNIHNDGVQVVVHKEPPSRRGSGPCSTVQWVQTPNGGMHLFCSFSTGKVASYALVDGASRLLFTAGVSVGVAVLSMVYSEGVLLVGCSDGGLRLLAVTLRQGNSSNNSNMIAMGFFFDAKPTLWKAVHGKAAPGICSISLAYTHTPGTTARRCICCTGAEDGSVALFELKLAGGLG